MAAPRRQTYVLILALISAMALLIFSSSARGQRAGDEIDEDASGAPYVAGELLVTYKENAFGKEVASAGREIGAEVEKEIPEINTQLLELPGIKNERAEVVRERKLERFKNQLAKLPAVESVDYNHVYTGSLTPRDPKFTKQWALKRTGFKRAWNKTRGKGVRIAIVDSGAAVRHVDLRYKIAARYDFRNRNRTVEDLNGHGTHVAGIAAAKLNRKGMVGGCPRCSFIIAKALNRNLIGYESDIADAIVWSADRGARVINLSLGGQNRSEVMKEAITYATRKRALVVAAGGNYGTRKRVYPAAYRRVLAVIHTDRYNRRSRSASHGKYVDLAAPGVSILSTVPGGYSYKSGSSMAAPHASGLAGLISKKVRRPGIVRKRMMRTAQDLGPKGRDPYYGRGLIRADRAVR